MEEALIRVGLTPLQARILARRGITPETLAAFLNPTLAALTAPAFGEMTQIAEKILSAVRARAPIVVFGDYDCDGVCATAILVNTLKALGATVTPFLPERLTEGYGMTEASVARMFAENPSVALVITVDNGINSIAQIAALKARAVEVIVTDHHLAGESLPDCPILHTTDICGAGVAFFLANALVTRAKSDGLYKGPNIGGPLLILAGLATVTDIMPLLGTNRVLVAEALKRFRAWAPIGLKELFDRAARTGTTTLTSKDFGFLLGPRINAAGRLASGTEALNLILATERETARTLARQVDLHNTTRKSIEQSMTEEALAQVQSTAAAHVIDLKGEASHQGIAGIVAARVMERLDPPVPVAVIVKGHGSARAPEGYHVRDALAAAESALVRFGGHAAAGGFSVADGALDRFRRQFEAACGAQAASCTAGEPGCRVYDAEVTSADLTLAFAEWLQTLEPFGEGNPMPTFLLRNVYLKDVRPLGLDAKHLTVTFQDNKIPRAIWWNRGDLVENLRAHSAKPHDLVFTVEVSTFGEKHAELRLQAISLS